MQEEYPDLISIPAHSVSELNKLCNIGGADPFIHQLLADDEFMVAATLAVPFYREQLFTQISAIRDYAYIIGVRIFMHHLIRY